MDYCGNCFRGCKISVTPTDFLALLENLAVQLLLFFTLKQIMPYRYRNVREMIPKLDSSEVL